VVGAPPPKKPKEPAAAPRPEGSGRDTLIPAFDPAAFAHDSDLRLRAEIDGGNEPLIERARREYRAGHYDRALDLLDDLHDRAPFHPQASILGAECRTMLDEQCLSALGSESARLTAALTPEELKGFTLDYASAALLAKLDGKTDVRTVLDVSGVPRLQALRHLRNLLERGIIEPASERREPAQPREAAVATTDRDASSFESGVIPMSVGTLRLDAVAILLVERSKLDALQLDARARALIAVVDDTKTVEQALVAAEMDMVAGTAVFEWLADDGIVGFV
jgi:hypothetical protein